MKKLSGIAILALGLSVSSYAQSTVDKTEHSVKKGAKKAWHATKKGAKKVGNETAEVTEKGVARITDKKSDSWVGPQGQTIYIDDLGKYYWVNEKGKRIFVNKSELKAKPKG